MMPQKLDGSVAAANPAERLREIRRMADASQRDFAASLGVSEATYQRAEGGASLGSDLLLGLTNHGWSADWVLHGRGNVSLDAIDEALQALAREMEGGRSSQLRAKRAAQSFDLHRLVDAYEAAQERIKAPIGRPPDAYKLLELTLTLYDALTISAEVVEAQRDADTKSSKGKG